MTHTQAIDIRISRRTYTGPVPEADAPALAALCEELSEAHGVYLHLIPSGAQKAFGGFGKSYGLFKGVQALVVLGVREKSDEAMEKIGYAGERVVLEATVRGLGTCWVGGTFDRDATQAAVPQGVEVVGVLTIGTVAQGETGKEKFLRGMMHRKSKTAAEMSEVEGEAPAWFTAGMQAVAKAPSAVHGQPVTVRWQGGVASARVPGARAMQYIDLGIAKLHFELGAGGGRFAVGNGGAYTPAAE